MFEFLVYEKVGKTAFVKMNRPETLNALNKGLKLEIIESFSKADQDKEVGAIVLTGEGNRAFSSGQDLKETKDMSASEADEWITTFRQLYDALRNAKKPTIAALNGVAAGSGLQIALLCDFRIAKKGIKIGMTEINIGLPLITGSGLLWNIAGPMWTKEMALTGELYFSEEAYEKGLINKLVDGEQFEKEVKKFAAMLASKPPNAIRITKDYYRMLEDELFSMTLSHAGKAHTEAYSTGEPQHFMRKFFEARAKKSS